MLGDHLTHWTLQGKLSLKVFFILNYLFLLSILIVLLSYKIHGGRESRDNCLTNLLNPNIFLLK